jgi:hypothetical protein
MCVLLDQPGAFRIHSNGRDDVLHQLQDRQVQHLNNDRGASSATTLLLLDQPGAFRIHPNGQDGVLHQLQDRQVQHLNNDRGASSAATLSLLDQPGAFQIHPNGQHGVHDRDDIDETMIVDDEVNARATLSPPRDNDSVAATSADSHLPIAQTLDEDALEKEVFDRVLSRQPVLQAESISQSSQSKTRLCVPVTFSFGFISALLVTLIATGELFPNRMDTLDFPSPTVTAPPAIAEGSSTTVDIQPVLQWLEPFLTNLSYSLPTDPTSAQYRAI